MISEHHRRRLSGGAVVLIGVAATRASPAFAQRLGGGADVDIPWWRVAAVLIVCVLMAGAAIYIARVRRGRPGANAPWPANLFEAMRQLTPAPRRLKVIETVRLSHQVDVCLLSCDEVEFIVAAGPNGATIIASPQGWPGPRLP